MKRIDAVMKVFKIDDDFYELLSPIFDDGLNDIFEIFVCLGKVKECAFLFVNPELFGDGGENLADNIDGIFKDEERFNDIRNYILENQPELNEEMDKEDILTLSMELAKVEADRWNTYSEWNDKGVSFDVFEEHYIENFIEEMIDEKLNDVVWAYAVGDLTEEELRLDLTARMSQKSL